MKIENANTPQGKTQRKARTMKLITKAIEKSTPALYANENKTTAEVAVTAKFFFPYGIGTWYMTEYDPKTRIAFGLCDIGFPELGYFTIDELEANRIERDMYFTPTSLESVMKQTAARHNERNE